LNVPAALEQSGETVEASRQSGSEPTRQWLLQELRRVMEIALDRVTNSKTAAEDRIKWSRIVIAAGGACNSVLRDIEVDELKHEITELKTLQAEKLDEEEDDEDRGAQAGDSEAQEEDT
jgi:hypothetical protein